MVPRKLPIRDNTNETMGTSDSVCVNTARDHRARKPHGESSPSPCPEAHAPQPPGTHPRGRTPAHPPAPPDPPQACTPAPMPPTPIMPRHRTRTDATAPQHTPDNAQPHPHARPHRHPGRHPPTAPQPPRCYPDAATSPATSKEAQHQKPRCGSGQHHVSQLTRLMLYI